jgi:hypothetical protein
LIWGGIIILAISGNVLSAIGSYFPSGGIIFIIKLVLVVVILGITLCIEFCVYQKAKKLDVGKNPEEMISLCKQSNWLCWTSMILWYAVIVLSVYSS